MMMIMVRKHLWVGSLKYRRKFQILPLKIFLLEQQQFCLEYETFIFQKCPYDLFCFFFIFTFQQASDTTSALSAFVSKASRESIPRDSYCNAQKNTDRTQNDLLKLEFTDLCAREILRLFPTASLISRISSTPIKLRNNIVIPPNISFIFGLRQMHIQEKYFGSTLLNVKSTANLFDPYRFLDNNGMKTFPIAAYIPRNCGKLCFLQSVFKSLINLMDWYEKLIILVGYRYAQVLVKCFIAHLIRNYRVTTNYTDIS